MACSEKKWSSRIMLHIKVHETTNRHLVKQTSGRAINLNASGLVFIGLLMTDKY